MDILIIVKSVDGGTGTFLRELSKMDELSSGKINFRVVALEKPSYRTIRSKDVVFFRKKDFYPQNYSLSLQNFLNLFRETTLLRKEITAFKPHIIMGIDLRCNLLAMASKIFWPQSKVALSTHVDLWSMTLKISSFPISALLRHAIRIIYTKADGLLSVSNELAKHLKKDFGITKEVVTIYNGLETKKRGVRKFPVNRVNILSVGRLNKQKNYALLIAAAKELKINKINFKLSIAGDGPERVSLQKLTSDLGLSKNISLLGWSKNTALLYRKADIFVLSSDFEGFGYVLIEAMSYGLPVVSTNAPHGPYEVLSGGKYGLLSPVGSKQKLVKNILGLIKSKQKYNHFSKMSILRSEFFSTDKMLSEYADFFRKLCK